MSFLVGCGLKGTWLSCMMGLALRGSSCSLKTKRAIEGFKIHIPYGDHSKRV